MRVEDTVRCEYYSNAKFGVGGGAASDRHFSSSFDATRLCVVRSLLSYTFLTMSLTNLCINLGNKWIARELKGSLEFNRKPTWRRFDPKISAY